MPLPAIVIIAGAATILTKVLSQGKGRKLRCSCGAFMCTKTNPKTGEVEWYCPRCG